MERVDESPNPLMTKAEAQAELEAAILEYDRAESDVRAAYEARRSAGGAVDKAEKVSRDACDRRNTALRQLHCALTGKVDIA